MTAIKNSARENVRSENRYQPFSYSQNASSIGIRYFVKSLRRINPSFGSMSLYIIGKPMSIFLQYYAAAPSSADNEKYSAADRKHGSLSI